MPQLSSYLSNKSTPPTLPPMEQRWWPVDVRTSVEIDAPRDKVWEILTDFQNYGSWNKLVPKMKISRDTFAVGKRFRTAVQTSTSRKTRFWAFVILADQYHYRWISVARNVFEIEHYFKLEECEGAPNRTRFVHGTVFSGTIPRLRKNYLLSYTKNSYDDMNNMLKQRVEVAMSGQATAVSVPVRPSSSASPAATSSSASDDTKIEAKTEASASSSSDPSAAAAKATDEAAEQGAGQQSANTSNKAVQSEDDEDDDDDDDENDA